MTEHNGTHGPVWPSRDEPGSSRSTREGADRAERDGGHSDSDTTAPAAGHRRGESRHGRTVAFSVPTSAVDAPPAPPRRPEHREPPRREGAPDMPELPELPGQAGASGRGDDWSAYARPPEPPAYSSPAGGFPGPGTAPAQPTPPPAPAPYEPPSAGWPGDHGSYAPAPDAGYPSTGHGVPGERPRGDGLPGAPRHGEARPGEMDPGGQAAEGLPRGGPTAAGYPAPADEQPSGPYAAYGGQPSGALPAFDGDSTVPAFDPGTGGAGAMSGPAGEPGLGRHADPVPGPGVGPGADPGTGSGSGTDFTADRTLAHGSGIDPDSPEHTLALGGRHRQEPAGRPGGHEHGLPSDLAGRHVRGDEPQPPDPYAPRPAGPADEDRYGYPQAGPVAGTGFPETNAPAGHDPLGRPPRPSLGDELPGAAPGYPGPASSAAGSAAPGAPVSPGPSGSPVGPYGPPPAGSGGPGGFEPPPAEPMTSDPGRTRAIGPDDLDAGRSAAPDPYATAPAASASPDRPDPLEAPDASDRDRSKGSVERTMLVHPPSLTEPPPAPEPAAASEPRGAAEEMSTRAFTPQPDDTYGQQPEQWDPYGSSSGPQQVSAHDTTSDLNPQAELRRARTEAGYGQPQPGAEPAGSGFGGQEQGFGPAQPAQPAQPGQPGQDGAQGYGPPGGAPGHDLPGQGYAQQAEPGYDQPGQGFAQQQAPGFGQPAANDSGSHAYVPDQQAGRGLGQQQGPPSDPQGLGYQQQGLPSDPQGFGQLQGQQGPPSDPQGFGQVQGRQQGPPSDPQGFGYQQQGGAQFPGQQAPQVQQAHPAQQGGQHLQHPHQQQHGSYAPQGQQGYGQPVRQGHGAGGFGHDRGEEYGGYPGYGNAGEDYGEKKSSAGKILLAVGGAVVILALAAVVVIYLLG